MLSDNLEQLRKRLDKLVRKVARDRNLQDEYKRDPRAFLEEYGKFTMAELSEIEECERERPEHWCREDSCPWPPITEVFNPTFPEE